jgi:dTDP-4-amino-4,6-dideoxygalactose transaminase
MGTENLSSVMNVPFVSLDRQYLFLRDKLIDIFDEIGKSGVYIMGEFLDQFEKELASYCGVDFALGVANGSDALFLILKALDIGPGDEVITCPNSFIATAWTIVATGAKPVFVDASDDYNINPDLIEAAISEKTRAIIPVHLTGRPADMDRINTIANLHKLFVIEDAAQAIGAKYKGKRVGSLGIAAAFSLHPLKNLGVYGDGGVITTDNKYLFDKMKLLRNHGLLNRDECRVWGYNSRLDTLQAAIASLKLKHLDSWNNRCREIAREYRNKLKDYVWVPEDKYYEEAVYHNFVIQTDSRDKLMTYLSQRGVGTRVHYPIPIHLQESACSLGYKKGDFPIVEGFTSRMLSLPIYPELVDNEVDLVISSVQDYFTLNN